MSYRLLLWLISICIFAALAACSRSDAETVAPTEVRPESSVVDAAPEETSPSMLNINEIHKGEATYYPANGKGSCSFDASKDLMVAAINSRDYAGATMCGAYLAVTGPKGTVTVRITDLCPGCKQEALDLSKAAFSRIASRGTGRVPVTWRLVAGPATKTVEYLYKNSSTRYWTAIQVRNHRWPITTLEIKPKDSNGWIRLERRPYNYFVYSKTIPAGPLHVRVTALTGDIIEDELPEPKSGLRVHGSVQFQ